MRRKSAKKVKFQISGIELPDLIRAQQKALANRQSLSSVMRDAIAFYSISGYVGSWEELDEQDKKFLQSRLDRYRKTQTPAHHKRIIKERITDELLDA